MVTCCLMSGCSTNSALSDESMIFSIIDQKKSLSYPTFYLEKKVSVYQNGSLISQEDIRWWRDSIQRKERKEFMHSSGEREILITDDKQSINWRHNKQLVQYEISAPEEIDSTFFLKEQTIQYLENVRDSYELTLVEEDTISSFHTYRINALPKKASAKKDYISIWIDKKSWMIVKEIKHSGDARVETRVTKFQKNQTFSNDTFFLHTIKATRPKPSPKKIMKPIDSTFYENQEMYGQFQRENWGMPVDVSEIQPNFIGAYTPPIEKDLELYSLQLNDVKNAFLAVYTKEGHKTYDLAVSKGKSILGASKHSVKYLFHGSPVEYILGSDKQVTLSWYYKNYTYNLTIYHSELENIQPLLNSLIPIK